MTHLALPVALAPDGRLVALPQDSPAEVAQSVALLLATRPGERRSVPDYGLPDPVFGGVDVDEIVSTVAEWEDRADPVTVEQLAEQIVAQELRVHPAIPTPDSEEV